ncbi:tetratricopeptide repeat protein [Winogradskya humida]|uniref:Tetratricopeptide repeat protein n=1 Tax=Winogradskya humida TaxID=113566 RepID=A0ABQ4A226_9ACTN|nr:tetratricopeptide repeat protein [Actinoplanes humidus]GIE24910.1 hypothetical protein Ahu01nite_080120 [Actinoplanes humidus]
MPESSAFPQARYQAQTLADAGEVAQAQAVLENAIEQGKTGLAEGDPELLATMRQLAALHTRLDDPTAARRLLEEAMAGAHRLPDTDPLRLMLTYDLAVVAEELANRHEARTNFTRVAQFGPAILGTGHWAVTNARTYLQTGTLPPSPVAPSSSPPSTFRQPAANPPPSSAPPLSGQPTSGVPISATPSSAAPFSAPPAGPRKWWMIAAAGVVVAALVITGVVLLRPDSPADPAPLAQTPTPPAPAATSQAPAVASQAPSPTTPPSAAPSTAPTTPPTTTTAAKPPATTRPTANPPAATTIVSPANGSLATWSFPAKFSLSPSDAAAKGTVLALSICVSGRCYLDGKVSSAPYPIHLGSSADEGIGLAWQLRVDRLSDSAFGGLMAERDTEIANGTWGEKGTSMSGLNKTPVSAVTVTKKT